MGIYRYSYMTSSKSFMYLYRCSKCGKLIAQRSAVEGESDPYDGRAGLTKNSADQAKQRAEAAAAAASSQAQSELERLVKKVRRKDFRGTKITGFCPLCKHQEPWQKLSPSGCMIPVTCLSLVPLFIGIGTMVTGEAALGAPYAGAGAVLLLLVVLSSQRRKKRIAQAKAMPEASLPHIYLTEAEFHEACRALGRQDGEEIYE